MDFSLSEEQVLLQDSIGRFVTDQCDVERHRRLARSEAGFDPAAWQQFAELGWLAIPFSEEHGGIGGSAVDVMLASEALGRGLLREPFGPTVISCGAALRHGGSAEQQARYIPAIIDGSSQWAFAFAEPTSGYNFASVNCRAQHCDTGYSLSGEKIAVLNGHWADYLVVTARTSGDVADASGISVFIVDATAPGISREPFTAVDGSRGAHLKFDALQLDRDSLLGTLDGGLPLVEAVVDDAILALGGEALGALQVLLEATVEYTRTREQFGQAISKFQALQHRMADMYLKVEELRALLYNAAIQLSEGSAEAPRACAALKVKIAEAGRFVSQEAVQLHGGIGMTDELIVGHLFKRLMLLSMLYGDEAYYLQRYMALASAPVPAVA